VSNKAARYRLVAHPDVPDDLRALSTYGADAVVLLGSRSMTWPMAA